MRRRVIDDEWHSYFYLTEFHRKKMDLDFVGNLSRVGESVDLIRSVCHF
jgi:hypothetical protein